jgi:hypothetical protein
MPSPPPQYTLYYDPNGGNTCFQQWLMSKPSLTVSGTALSIIGYSGSAQSPNSQNLWPPYVCPVDDSAQSNCLYVSQDKVAAADRTTYHDWYKNNTSVINSSQCGEE